MIPINETLIITSILLFSWLEFFWELYLCCRQLNIYQGGTEIPQELKDIHSPEGFAKARLYGNDKLRFRIIKDTCMILFSSAVLYYGWFALAWSQAENIGLALNFSTENEIMISIIFSLFVNLVTTIIELPFSVYSVFVLEEKHGFNKQTFAFYCKDQIKSIIVGNAIMLPLAAAAVYIIQLGGNMFVVWLWVFATVTTIVLLMVYPSVIAPLFDKFTPLEEGSLRTGIENLAASLNFPLSQVYIVEGSKRSAHSNAYFSGIFGSKRIVLFDTLIEKYDDEKKVTTGCSEKEILGVLAHELGHWHCNHIYKFIFITEVNLFLLFSAFGILFQYSMLYTALGFSPGTQPILVGLIVVMQLVLAPYNSILSFFTTVLSRKFEFEADNFAVSLKYANELMSSLKKLGRDNLDYPIYDTLYSAWHHSHPTLLQRIQSIKQKTD